MADPIENTCEALGRVRAALESSVIGQRALIEQLMVCAVAGGHALLHGGYGVGKTFVARAFASALSLEFARILCTGDLEPSDVLGHAESRDDGRGRKRTEFAKGPIFSHVVLADDFNRAPGRTQSTFFDAVDFRAVQAASERRTLEPPFMLLAVEDPSTSASDAMLSQSQRDRFMLRIDVARPDPVNTVAILARTTGTSESLPPAAAKPTVLLVAKAVCRSVSVRPRLFEWIADLLGALDPAQPEAHARTRAAVLHGPSLRGGQSLVLAAKAAALLRGRMDVEFEDIERMVRPALRHRIVLLPEMEREGFTPDALLDEIVPTAKSVPPPPQPDETANAGA